MGKMVRPERRSVLAGVSLVRVTAGAPGSRLQPGERSFEPSEPDLWFFACHFEGDPVMPGCLGLDALLLGFYLGWTGASGSGRALGVGEVKFSGQVLPEAKKVTYRINIKRVINCRLVNSASATAWLKWTAK